MDIQGVASDPALGELLLRFVGETNLQGLLKKLKLCSNSIGWQNNGSKHITQRKIQYQQQC